MACLLVLFPSQLSCLLVVCLLLARGPVAGRGQGEARDAHAWLFSPSGFVQPVAPPVELSLPPSVGPSGAWPPSAGPPGAVPPSVGHQDAVSPSVGPPGAWPPSVGPSGAVPPLVGPSGALPPSVGPSGAVSPSVPQEQAKGPRGRLGAGGGSGRACSATFAGGFALPFASSGAPSRPSPVPLGWQARGAGAYPCPQGLRFARPWCYRSGALAGGGRC